MLTRPRQVARSMISTPRRVLAFFASNSLFWWYLPDIIDLLGTPIVVFTVVAQLWILGVVSEWALGLYAFYCFFPAVLPTTLDHDGFQILAAAITVGIGILTGMAAIWPSPTATLLQEIGVTYTQGYPFVLVSTLVVGGIAIGMYVYHQVWRGTNRAGKGEIISDVTGYRPKDPVEGVNELMYILSIILYLLLVCAFLGGFAGVISYFFPLPEILVLGGVSASVITSRLSREEHVVWFPKSRLDVTNRFYRIVGYATTSDKGGSAVLIVLAGLGLSIIPILVSMVGFGVLIYLVAVGIEYQVVAVAVLQHPLITAVSLWNLLGFFLCLTVPGFYALWYWLRVANRLPYFLVRWENVWGEGSSIEEMQIGRMKELPPLVTRPPGYLLPPTSLLGVAVLFFQWAPNGDPSIVELGDLLFALVWPALIVGLVWTVRWTYDMKPQRPIKIKTESLAHLLPISLQLAWIAGVATIQGSSILPWRLASIVGALLLFLYYAPEIMSGGIFSGQRDWLNAYLLFVLMILLGTIAAVWSTVAETATVSGMYAPAVLLAVVGAIGLLTVITIRINNRR